MTKLDPSILDAADDAALDARNRSRRKPPVPPVLDQIVQGQSVMLATNQILTIVAAVFALGAAVIWLAPRPTRAVDMTKAGH
jgi:hypothetical protein